MDSGCLGRRLCPPAPPAAVQGRCGARPESTVRSSLDAPAACTIWPGSWSTRAREVCPHPRPLLFRGESGPRLVLQRGRKSQRSESVLGVFSSFSEPRLAPLWPCLACLLPAHPRSVQSLLILQTLSCLVLSSLLVQGLTVDLVTQMLALLPDFMLLSWLPSSCRSQNPVLCQGQGP